VKKREKKNSQRNLLVRGGAPSVPSCRLDIILRCRAHRIAIPYRIWRRYTGAMQLFIPFSTDQPICAAKLAALSRREREREKKNKSSDR